MKHPSAALPLLFMFCVLALIPIHADAEAAPDLTARCKYACERNRDDLPRLKDGRYDRYWDGTGKTLTVTLPDEACQGVSLSFFSDPVPLIAETMGADGAWHETARYQAPYRNAYFPFCAEGAFRLRAQNPSDPLKISKLSIFGRGELPDSVQQWQTLSLDTELMLIVTHPDDDLLWFGGLLPTYAGEYGRRVTVVYAMGEASRQRVNELLDGLWTCGVRTYPEIGPFTDFYAKNPETVVRRLGGPEVLPSYLLEVLNRYRPQVVVTQGLKGEYGHPQHIALVQAVIEAVQRASAQDGEYAPMKLYLHSYRENEIRFDWNKPLAAFSGRSGRDIAAEAFKKHISQQKSSYHIMMRGPMDSQLFGLYWSRVGLDEAKDDLFEHCASAQKE